MTKKQKLELTWIGKDEQPVLEPRILIEDPTKSYGDPHSENTKIWGQANNSKYFSKRCGNRPFSIL